MKRALIFLPLLLTGCGVTRDGTIRPSVNDCVAALPVAQSLVGSHARLEVLRRYSLNQTQAVLRRLGATALTPSDATPAERASIAAERASAGPTAGPTAGPGRAGPGRAGPGGPSGGPGPSEDGPRPCAVVFTGSFTPAALRTSPGHPAADAVSGAGSGGYVLVITTTRHPRVLRAVVTLQDPLD